ncbi:MAG: glycosyltransferase family 4 protein [Candidatus Nomurabacteria bacterium]|nr:glycosyltransferase family 4 protein [Candidatus Saccharibacteria bacterium]USN95525.1 MAG: glycosyltransferase family 4 protein [Candidatus Nomurabacteria bacterium]
MTIGFVIDDTLDSTDGVQQYVLLLGDWLSSKGYKVVYLTGQSKRTDINNLHSLSKNIRVRFNKNRLSIPLPVSSNKIQSIFDRYNFDVLHIQMPYSPLLAGKIIQLAPKGTVLIGTFHIAPHSKSVVLGSKILGTVQKQSISKFNKIISVSSVAQEFAKQVYGVDSIVIPNAVNIQSSAVNLSKRDIDIVFVGRLVKRKGCIYLLNAISKLKQRDLLDDIKVVIVGDGTERAKLQNYVHTNNLSANCEFKGFVSDDEKMKLLSRSKLAVFPSTGGESFGIVLIEALASGATVLAGGNPGYASVLGSVSESMFNPYLSDELAEKLYSLLTNDAKRKHLNDLQQNLLDQFDINRVGSAILKLYNQEVRSNHEQA